MIAAYEFLVVTPAIANLIRENKVYRIDSSIQTGKKYGMQLLDEHLWELFKRGDISAEDAIDRSKHPGDMQDKIDMHRRGLELTDVDTKATGDEARPEDSEPVRT